MTASIRRVANDPATVRWALLCDESPILALDALVKPLLQAGDRRRILAGCPGPACPLMRRPRREARSGVIDAPDYRRA